MTRYFCVTVALLAAGLVNPLSTCRAQTSSGEIFGRVADASGAVISGAKVTLRNEQTGEERVAKTGTDGLFSFPSIPPGSYSVLVQASGFKGISKTDLNLSAAQRLSAGTLELEVGAVTE